MQHGEGWLNCFPTFPSERKVTTTGVFVTSTFYSNKDYITMQRRTGFVGSTIYLLKKNFFLSLEYQLSVCW